jgi:hypothetical protein
VSGTDHGNKADALNKIEAELGVLPKGSHATVKARLDALDSVHVIVPAATGVAATDTTNIQAAVDAAEASGGVVRFPKGAYVLNATITIDADNVHLIGAGHIATKILAPAASIGLDFGNGTTLRHYNSLRNIAVSRSPVGTAASVRLNKVDQAIVDGCTLGYGTYGLDTSACIALSVTNNFFNNNSTSSIRLAGSSDLISIAGNLCESNEGATHHVEIAGTHKNIAITGNDFSTADRPIGVTGGTTTDVAITGNTVENCPNGITLGTTTTISRCTVTGNVLRGTGAGSSWGIRLYGQAITVSGNTVTNFTVAIEEAGASTAGNLIFGNRVDTDVGLQTPTTSAAFGNMRGDANLLVNDGTNLKLGTVTGTKIGTGSTQKLGFYGVTPVVRPSAYTVTNALTDRAYDANATTTDELADVLGTLIGDLRNLGLVQ